MTRDQQRLANHLAHIAEAIERIDLMRSIASAVPTPKVIGLFSALSNALSLIKRCLKK